MQLIIFSYLIFDVFEAGECVALKINAFKPVAHRTSKDDPWIIEWLVDYDDVQEVYHDAELPEEEEED